jgi:hypothetical protein
VSGREADDAWLEEERRREGVPDLASAYDQRFPSLNVTFKELCSRWQRLLPDDRERRWQAVDQLERLHGRVQSMLQASDAFSERFVPYRDRLESALRRLRGGEEAYFTSPRVDSYHSVWFEWHQDLLLTLGRTREQEGSF